MRYKFLLAFALCLFLSTGTAHASFEEGKAAFDRKDWPVATQYLLPLAQEEHAGALLLFGKMYADGLGIPQDLKKAFDLFLRSAKKGNTEAMVSVAAFYGGDQTAVEPNKKAALEWFRKAAEQNHSVAQFALGMALTAGDKDVNLQANLIESYKWLSLAGRDDTLPLRIRRTSNKLARHIYDKEMEIKNRPIAEERLAKWRPKKWEDLASTHIYWNTDTDQDVVNTPVDQPDPQEPETPADHTEDSATPETPAE